MRRYTTQIVIPADRYVAVQLPDDLPEGRAILMVHIPEFDSDDFANDEDGYDREDIEWWEEFEDAVR